MDSVVSRSVLKHQTLQSVPNSTTSGARTLNGATCRTPSLSSRCSSFSARFPASLSNARQMGQQVLRGGERRISAVSSAEKEHPGPVADFDWANLSFGLTPTTSMFVGKCTLDGEWSGGLEPYGELSLSPAAAVLNYGQGVFEGMKAYRTDKDRVCIFRPDENAARMQIGATRMSMPPVPADFFKNAINQVVAANAHWIPDQDVGQLYIRPLLIGTGPILGVAPAPEYTLVIYVSPVAAYFAGGQLTPIDLYCETGEAFRACQGGTGGVKAVGNYSQMIQNGLKRKKEGYADVIYLDSREGKYVEEVSTCNLFMVKGNTISTPVAGETVLSGITRKSVIELARSKGYTVEERPIAATELMEADEVFTTGTAVVIMPVGGVMLDGTKKEYHNGEVGPVAGEIYKSLTDIQLEKAEDPFGWVVEVPPQ
mmetsp:Transcript_29953/g.36370  ORF Transcript_29953/g.36370 Transcript_29953/m.36370 type:complete len:426 (+) Transcript_29953:112-1389(+)|eukprot:CAMPEP_0197860172 /NCGR_PEP_ID=MMETSP1438-20131217/35353_1 /TAXON_ID=1461541 /ORGANISM="Pterosperma sp., Strain CCMP1384" /LENGTH=425 /DNA_ID=CAMNT_0043476943 /DNA_START=101 /DNA_END=1378 /DNA_ORIENTATION=+